MTPSLYSVTTPESYVSPGLALAKKINGSVMSRLSVPVVVNVPLTTKSPTQVMFCPTFKLPIMPTPPPNIPDPVATFELIVLLVIARSPLALMLPETPIPPLRTSTPVVLLVLAALELILILSEPATVTVIDVALAQ